MSLDARGQFGPVPLRPGEVVKPRRAGVVRCAPLLLASGGDDGRYTYFTLALSYLRGRFTDDHLASLADELDVELDFYYTRCPRPFFTLPFPGDPWPSMLWAMDAETYVRFELAMLSVDLFDPACRRVYGVGVTSFVIPDPRVDPPLVGGRTITFNGFGVNASHHAWAFTQGVAGEPIGAARFPPLEAKVRLAERAFGASGCREG